MKAARGFTLLELLVALALLALLAGIGFRGLAAILDADEHVRAESRRWTEAAAVMTQIGHDLSLARERPELGAAGELLIARMGDSGALHSQAGPRRVAYRLREGALDYLEWSAGAATPLSTPVMENVAALELRALAADGAWLPLREAKGAPRALEVRIVLAGGESISRLFLLP